MAGHVGGAVGLVSVLADDILSTSRMALCDGKCRKLRLWMDLCHGPFLFPTYECGDHIN